jgi:O-antigen ligase
MVAWLLYMADSATSLMTFVTGVGIISMSSLPKLTRRPITLVRLGLLLLVVISALEVAFGLSAMLISALGRDLTLTTRVPMWFVLLSMAENPVIGTGFESFWLGSRLGVLYDMFGVRTAHNGYLQLYLDLGILGVAIVVLSAFHGLVRLRTRLKDDYAFSILKITYIVVIILYNWTEATFFGVSDVWLLFMLSAMDVRTRRAPLKSPLVRSTTPI